MSTRYYLYMFKTLKHLSLWSVLAVLVGMGLLLVFYSTAVQSSAPAPRLYIASSTLPVLSAQSAFVVDVATGQEIYAKDPDTQRPVASVTKLLSSAMFYEYATGTDTATVSAGDVATEGRSGRLSAGDQYQNQELLFPVLLESSNDAASTMGRVAPVNLVDSMNAYTQEQQLHQTSFADTSGLSSENISTARELSALGIALHKEYPHVFDITQLRQYLNHVNAWMNNSPFADEDAYAGGKHGYTYEANRTAIAFFNETLSSGAVRQLVYVLLGSDDLALDTQTLRNYVQQTVDFK